MRSRIDAVCATGDNRPPAQREVGCQLACDVRPVLRRGPRTHHCHRANRCESEVSTDDVQSEGSCRAKRRQLRRPLAITGDDEPATDLVEPALRQIGVDQQAGAVVRRPR